MLVLFIEDGAFIEAGENDNLIIQKLDQNPDAIGIFGFSFLDQNADKVQGSVVNGAEPTFDIFLSVNTLYQDLYSFM